MAEKKDTPAAAGATKSRRAYDALREMIISKEFSPGNPWSLRKLAERLKMSVVPITESLRRLEQEGILEVRPQRGITVRQLSAQEMQDLQLIREGLEVQAARLLALCRPRQALAKLRQLAQRLQKAMKEEKYARAQVIDFQLHQTLVEAAGAPLLTQRYNQLVTLTMIGSGTWGPRLQQVEFEGPGNHVRLIEAIAAGDPDRADRAIRDHIRTQADASSAH